MNRFNVPDPSAIPQVMLQPAATRKWTLDNKYQIVQTRQQILGHLAWVIDTRQQMIDNRNQIVDTRQYLLDDRYHIVDTRQYILSISNPFSAAVIQTHYSSGNKNIQMQVRSTHARGSTHYTHCTPLTGYHDAVSGPLLS